MNCDGCGAPIEGAAIVYQPRGFSEHHFDYPSCLEDWIEKGCIGQHAVPHSLYGEPVRKERLTLSDRFWRAVSRYMWGER